jgi:hypothetical protein
MHVAAAGYTVRAASTEVLVCRNPFEQVRCVMHGIDPMLPYNLAGGGPFRGHMWGSAEFLDTKSRGEGHTMVAACGFWCRGWGLYFCTLVSGAGLFASSVQCAGGVVWGWHWLAHSEVCRMALNL